jgi:hypothetical protein
MRRHQAFALAPVHALILVIVLVINVPPSGAYSVGKMQSLQTSPGVYYEPLFEGLDWMIQQAGRAEPEPD